MPNFRAGDKVIVKRARKTLYNNYFEYTSFPEFMEGKETTVVAVYSGEPPYKVEGCYPHLYEYELNRVLPTEEAEWE